MREQREGVRLTALLISRPWQWLFAFALLLSTLIAGIGLLTTSGWFITVAALAGLCFIEINYWTAGSLIRAFALMRTTFRYGGDLVSHNAILYLLKDLRVKLFTLFAKAGVNWDKNQYSSAVIMHRLMRDIDWLDLFPLKFMLPWGAGILMMGVFLTGVYWLCVPLFVYIVFPVLLAIFGIPLISLHRGLKLAWQEVLHNEESKTDLVRYIFLLTPLILWRSWPKAERYLQKENQIRLRVRLSIQRYLNVLRLGQDICLWAAVLLMLWSGSFLVAQEKITPAWLLAVVFALMGLKEAAAPMVEGFLSLSVSRLARDRLDDLIKKGIKCSNFAYSERETIKELQLKNVGGRIIGALNGPEKVNITIRPGEILVIQGPSGVGKSTLLSLIAGEIPLQAGQILLNGHDLSDQQRDSRLGYLSQQLDLFDWSLGENLRLAKENAEDEELWQVLAKVRLVTWAKKRQGLNTELGEEGSAVSGGEGRRIALARLLLADRDILLLDEPFAGLDEENTAFLYQTLKEYGQKKIILVVSHYDLSPYGARVYRL